MSCGVISCHFTLCHIMSCHVMTYYVMTCLFLSCHDTVSWWPWYFVQLHTQLTRPWKCCVISFCVMSWPILSCHNVSLASIMTDEQGTATNWGLEGVGLLKLRTRVRPSRERICAAGTVTERYRVELCRPPISKENLHDQNELLGFKHAHCL